MRHVRSTRVMAAAVVALALAGAIACAVALDYVRAAVHRVGRRPPEQAAGHPARPHPAGDVPDVRLDD